MSACDPERLADLHRAMQLIAEAVARLPDGRRDVSGNALLNVVVEAVIEDAVAPRPAASSRGSPSCWSTASNRR